MSFEYSTILLSVILNGVMMLTVTCALCHFAQRYLTCYHSEKCPFYWVSFYWMSFLLSLILLGVIRMNVISSERH